MDAIYVMVDVTAQPDGSKSCEGFVVRSSADLADPRRLHGVPIKDVLPQRPSGFRCGSSHGPKKGYGQPGVTRMVVSRNGGR